MALFERNQTDTKKQYLVMLDKNGENVVAYVNPASKVPLEVLETALKDKGINVEIRDVAPDIEKLEL